MQQDRVQDDLPEVGAQYDFKGRAVTVASVRKRGRGHQVNYSGDGFIGTARLREWAAKAQRVES